MPVYLRDLSAPPGKVNGENKSLAPIAPPSNMNASNHKNRITHILI